MSNAGSGLLVRGREELFDGQPRLCDQTAQRVPCNFRVIGYRERGDVPGLVMMI